MLSVFRESFEMEFAFISEFVGDEQVLRKVDGDAESFGVREGTSVPLEESVCVRIVDGRLPKVIPDARTEEETKDLSLVEQADVGAYVGFPLHLSDGRLYGTLCCASHSPDPWLRDRDLKLAGEVARKATERLESEGLL